MINTLPSELPRGRSHVFDDTFPRGRRAFHLGPKSRTGGYLEMNVTSTLIWIVTGLTLRISILTHLFVRFGSEKCATTLEHSEKSADTRLGESWI